MVSHPGEGLERKGICRATHGDEQGRIVCKLLSQLLRCSGAEINANLLHNGKDFWMYAHSWLGACRNRAGLRDPLKERLRSSPRSGSDPNAESSQSAICSRIMVHSEVTPEGLNLVVPAIIFRGL